MTKEADLDWMDEQLDNDLARARAALAAAEVALAAQPNDAELQQRYRRLECSLGVLLWGEELRRQARRAALVLNAHRRAN